MGNGALYMMKELDEISLTINIDINGTKINSHYEWPREYPKEWNEDVAGWVAHLWRRHH